VLVSGGYDSLINTLASAEKYDPQSETWTLTGSLQHARANHAAASLPTGTVLVTGGIDQDILASTEIYQPEQGTWTAAGDMNEARGFHTAVPLRNGKVLVAGGLNDSGEIASAELFEPRTITDKVAP